MTKIKLPSPLVPVAVDLRNYPCLPIDIARLFASEFHCRANDAEWRAGVTLWLKSFHEVPAGSLPDDDLLLARLAEFGKDTEAWQKVKEQALHNWVRCSDGRYYHPVVSVKALEAWLDKVARQLGGITGNAKRWKRAIDASMLENGFTLAISALAALDPNSSALSKHRPVIAAAIASPSDTDRSAISERTDTELGSERITIANEMKLNEMDISIQKGNSTSDRVVPLPRARDRDLGQNGGRA